MNPKITEDPKTWYIDNAEIERVRHYQKKEQLLSRFSKEFKELFEDGNSQANAIVEALIRDSDPYALIDHLLTINKTGADRFMFLAKRADKATMDALSEEINYGRI